MATQTTLTGNSVRIESPNVQDRFRECCETIEAGDPTQTNVCDNAPFLTVVSESDGKRYPYCKVHAKQLWLDEYGKTQ